MGLHSQHSGHEAIWENMLLLFKIKLCKSLLLPIAIKEYSLWISYCDASHLWFLTQAQQAIPSASYKNWCLPVQQLSELSLSSFSPRQIPPNSYSLVRVCACCDVRGFGGAFWRRVCCSMVGVGRCCCHSWDSNSKSNEGCLDNTDEITVR